MSEENNKVESKVEKKRLRGRNSYEVVNQIVEKYNSSEGWALKRVNTIGMNIEVHLERSADQKSKVDKTDNTDGTDSTDSTKEVSNAKQGKKETVKKSEPQAQSKEVVADVDDTESKTDGRKPTAKRGRASTKK